MENNNAKKNTTIVLCSMSNAKAKDYNTISYCEDIVDTDYYRGGSVNYCTVPKKCGWYSKLDKSYFFKPLNATIELFRNNKGEYRPSIITIFDDNGEVICTR